MKYLVWILLLLQYIYVVWRKSLESKTLLKLTQKSAESQTSVLFLADDLLLEIISRLPYKDMARYKLVSKSWNRLISQGINSKIAGFFVHTGCPGAPWDFSNMTQRDTSFVIASFNSLPFTPSPQNFLDSCNGCLLFFDPSSAQFYVLNPITKQYVAILHPGVPHGIKCTCHCAGLTFGKSRYNIVYIPPIPGTLRVYVFSSSSQTWAVYPHLPLESSILKSRWATRYIFIGTIFYRLSASRHILKFGPKGVEAIKLPEIVTIENSNIGTFGVSQGRLHYAWGGDTKQLMVWMLDESNPTPNWVSKHTLLLRDLAAQYPILGLRSKYTFKFSVYSFHPTSNVLILGNLSDLFTYDPNKMTVDNIFRADSSFYMCCGQNCTFPFTRNLTSLDVYSSPKQDKVRRKGSRKKKRYQGMNSIFYGSPELP